MCIKSSRPHISQASFEAAFPHLVASRYRLPKARLELHMLLLGTTFELDAAGRYSEAEINQHLQSWIRRFGADLAVDHAALRRYLVDEDVLSRNATGSEYALSHEHRHFTYDESIRSVDLDRLVSRAQSTRAARKRAFLTKAPRT